MDPVGWHQSAMMLPIIRIAPPRPPLIMCLAAALQQWCWLNSVTLVMRSVVSLNHQHTGDTHGMRQHRKTRALQRRLKKKGT